MLTGNGDCTGRDDACGDAGTDIAFVVATHVTPSAPHRYISGVRFKNFSERASIELRYIKEIVIDTVVLLVILLLPTAVVLYLIISAQLMYARTSGLVVPHIVNAVDVGEVRPRPAPLVLAPASPPPPCYAPRVCFLYTLCVCMLHCCTAYHVYIACLVLHWIPMTLLTGALADVVAHRLRCVPRASTTTPRTACWWRRWCSSSCTPWR